MGNDSDQRCHGGCQIGGLKVSPTSDAWAAISRPQTQCRTSHHRPGLPPEQRVDPAAAWEYIASHIPAFRLKSAGDLEAFTLVLDEPARNRYRLSATAWETVHSDILVKGMVPDFGAPASPVVDTGGVVVAHVQQFTATTGVFAVRLFDADGTQLFGTTVGELGLEDDVLGNELASALATLGVSAAVSVARRIATTAASAGIRATVRAGASRLLASIAALASKLTIDLVTRQSLRRLARAFVFELRAAGKSVVVNLGGAGEVAAAINVNPLKDQQTKAIPKLLRAGAEEVGLLFERDSVDRVVSNNVVRGQVDWNRAARGSFDILKPGGKISIAPFTGDLRAHLFEIAKALEQAGFKNIEMSQAVVTAVKR